MPLFHSAQCHTVTTVAYCHFFFKRPFLQHLDIHGNLFNLTVPTTVWYWVQCSSKPTAFDATNRKLLFELFPITLLAQYPDPPTMMRRRNCGENYDQGGSENDYYAFQSLCSPTPEWLVRRPHGNDCDRSQKNYLMALFSIQVMQSYCYRISLCSTNATIDMSLKVLNFGNIDCMTEQEKLSI